MRQVIRLIGGWLAFGCTLLLPTAAYAQAALSGIVRDPSGAVLPGVAVEVSSAALTERSRQGVTDSTGQYRITELPPGTYTVRFTLNGFSAVRREGVEVAGSGVITISADMQIGNLTESVTITGETPIVDIQSARHEQVISGATISALPVSRGYGALLTAIPGLMTSGSGQIFSSQTTPQMTFFTAHGGRIGEGRVMIDGLNTAAAFGGGGVSTLTYDVTNVQELQVLVSGGLGESETGGPIINLVSRSGGNTFRGSTFVSYAGEWASANNVDDRLRAAGVIEAPAVINTWDVNGTFGGPIRRDHLWFFTNLRGYGEARPVEGLFANANAGDASRWDYVPNPNVLSRTALDRKIYEVRLTTQATPRNKISGSVHYETRCEGSGLTQTGGACRAAGSDWVALGSTFFGRTSPEAHANYLDTYYNVTQLTWTSPATSKLLFEGGYSRFHYTYGGDRPPDGISDLIRVTEQSARYGAANFNYRGIDTFDQNDALRHDWRGTASYVTGAHNMKVGWTGSIQMSDQTQFGNSNLISYTFNSPPASAVLTPTMFTFRIAPWGQRNRTLWNAFYVQDQWTRKRLTVQGALRYDRASSWSPAEHNGTSATTIFNAAPISFPRIEGVNSYNDITPRLGAAYDLFGNGKTAVKVNAGKYLDAATNDANYSLNNPASNFGAGARFVTSTSRTWTDANGNKRIDCSLTNPLAQNNTATGGDTCGQWSNLNFGNAALLTTTVNPDLLRGWGVRPWDWQFGLAVQQQIHARVSVEVAYNRRWFGNFTVTDNLVRNPGDYDTFTINAPLHPSLPGGGGYPLTFTDLKQSKFGQASRNFVTFETDYADARTAYWHGVDVTANARMRNGLMFQGGSSTGRGVRDYCALNEKLPELFDPVFGTRNQMAGCHVTESWATSLRGLASYTVPKVDVLVSAAIRSVGSNFPLIGSVASNGASLNAFYQVPNAVVERALGRLPSGAVPNPNGTTGVDLLLPGQMYGEDRVNQTDLRFAKVFRFGARRLDVGLDLFNVFNSNDVTVYDGQFGTDGSTWLRPTGIVNPRFVRFNMTLDF